MDYCQTERGYTIRLDRGEEIVATLGRFLAEQRISAGALTAIGAVDQAELGLFSMRDRQYWRRRFDGEYEIVALTGNVTVMDGKPFCHLHILLSDEDYKVIGGHLFEARVGVTCEIDLAVYGRELRRSRDETTTLNLMDFGSGNKGS